MADAGVGTPQAVPVIPQAMPVIPQAKPIVPQNPTSNVGASKSPVCGENGRGILRAALGGDDLPAGVLARAAPVRRDQVAVAIEGEGFPGQIGAGMSVAASRVVRRSHPDADKLHMRTTYTGKLRVQRGPFIDAKYADYSDIHKAVPTDAANGGDSALQEQEPEHEHTKAQDHEHDPDPFYHHRISPDDTLEGILIRHNIKLAELKRWNAFPGRQFNACTELRIPKRLLPPDFTPQAPPSRAELVAQLRREAGNSLSYEEAVFYLDDAEWQVPNALEAVRADDEFEEQQQKEQ